MTLEEKGSLFAIELKKVPPAEYFQRHGIHIVANENIIILCPCLTLTEENYRNLLSY